MTQITTHDSTKTDRELAEGFWKLLMLLSEEKLRFPIAISPERDSDHGPRLCVQVEQADFRSYFEHVNVPAMRSVEHEGQMHVHVTGTCRGKPIHVLSVMSVNEHKQIDEKL